MDSQVDLHPGMSVFGADGDKIGTVIAVDPRFIVVEKGFFFPTDHYIPTSAIAGADGEEVHLAVTKEEALAQSWEEPTVTTLDQATGAPGTSESGDQTGSPR